MTLQSNEETGLAEESLKPVGMAAEAATPETQLVTNRRKALGAEVGRGGPLAPRPQGFDRIQLGGVRRQAMHRQPRGLGLEVATGLEAAVCVEPVPKQDHPSPEMTPQVSEEAHHLAGADRARMRHQEDAGVLRRSRAVGQSADHREVVPAAEAMGQDRRLATRRPGSTDRRALEEAALVDEDERRVATRGVFFWRRPRPSSPSAGSLAHRVPRRGSSASGATSPAGAAPATRGQGGNERR